MKLVKTSILSGISTFIKIFIGLISLKIVAMYTGPTGVAILGQFSTLINILAVIAGGGLSIGVIRYVAEFAYTKESLQRFLSTAMVFTVLFSIISMSIGIIFSNYLSGWIFASKQYAYLIRWLSIAQIFMALNLLIIAILNGLKKITLLVTINVISSVVTLFFIAIMTVFFGLHGCLLGLVIAQALSGLVAIGFVYKESWIKFLSCLSIKTTDIKNRINDIKNLSLYSLMNIISTVTVPVSQLIIRKYILLLFGWQLVGYWQAVVRLSDAYLLFITTVLTAYYLPRLSELRALSAIKAEIAQAYKIILPAIFLILSFIYFFRDEILTLLYNPHFSPARNLFFYQLIGDFFRTAGWLSTYLLLAKSWTKTYIVTEIVLSVLFVVLGHIMIRNYGLIGVTYAFASTYFLYWLLMAGITIFFFKYEENLCLQEKIP